MIGRILSWFVYSLNWLIPYSAYISGPDPFSVIFVPFGHWFYTALVVIFLGVVSQAEGKEKGAK